MYLCAYVGALSVISLIGITRQVHTCVYTDRERDTERVRGSDREQERESERSIDRLQWRETGRDSDGGPKQVNKTRASERESEGVRSSLLVCSCLKTCLVSIYFICNLFLTVCFNSFFLYLFFCDFCVGFL